MIRGGFKNRARKLISRRRMSHWKDKKSRAAKKNVEVAKAKLTEAKRGLFPNVQGVMEINGGKVPEGGVPR